MTDDFDLDVLGAVHATQIAVADRISRGGWRYDLIYSLLVAALVAAPGAGVFAAIPIELGVLVALVTLAALWARRTGVWISGITPKKARWVAVFLGVVLAAAYLGGMAAIDLAGMPRWIVVFTAAAVFVAALGGSRLWRRVYRQEMGLKP